METKNLSNPQADTDAQFVKFRYPAETMKRISGNPALGEKMIFLRKTGSVSPKETQCLPRGLPQYEQTDETDRTPHKHVISHYLSSTYRVRSYTNTAQRPHSNRTPSVLCGGVRSPCGAKGAQHYHNKLYYNKLQSFCAVCGQKHDRRLTQSETASQQTIASALEKPVCVRQAYCPSKTV